VKALVLAVASAIGLTFFGTAGQASASSSHNVNDRCTRDLRGPSVADVHNAGYCLDRDCQPKTGASKLCAYYYWYYWRYYYPRYRYYYWWFRF